MSVGPEPLAAFRADPGHLRRARGRDPRHPAPEPDPRDHAGAGRDRRRRRLWAARHLHPGHRRPRGAQADAPARPPPPQGGSACRGAPAHAGRPGAAGPQPRPARRARGLPARLDRPPAAPRARPARGGADLRGRGAARRAAAAPAAAALAGGQASGAAGGQGPDRGRADPAGRSGAAAIPPLGPGPAPCPAPVQGAVPAGAVRRRAARRRPDR